MRKKVMIVDEHPIVRQGVTELIEREIEAIRQVLSGRIYLSDPMRAKIIQKDNTE